MRWLRRLFAIILLIIAIWFAAAAVLSYFGAGSALAVAELLGMPAVITGLVGSATTWMFFAGVALLAVVGAALVDPQFTAETIQKIGTVIGAVTDTVGGVVGGGISAVLKGLGPVGWIGIGVATYLLLGKGEKGDSPSRSGRRGKDDDDDFEEIRYAPRRVRVNYRT